MTSISDLERYKIVSGRIDLHHQKIVDAFNLYVKLISALAAGIVWLRLSDKWAVVWSDLRRFAIGILLLVALSTASLIFFNLRAWWGYRAAESQLTGGDAPAPQFPRSCTQEIVMFAVIILATVLGICFMRGLH